MTKVKSDAILVIEVKKTSKNKNKTKKMKNSIISSSELGFNHVGWRYYNEIKKKAMSQEFSMQSLILSLSIAFFIVAFTAIGLNFVYYSVLN